MVKIGHASGDENSSAKGGAVGDQTKKEVCTRNWYNKGWNVVVRPKDEKVAEKIAFAMEQACANDNIGYDQSNRLSLFKLAKLKEFKLNEVDEKCECDCSSLVAVCVNAAGVKVNSGIYTGNMVGALELTGQFDILKDSVYTSGYSKLKRGDILVKEFGHTAVVLSNDSKETEESKQVKSGTVQAAMKKSKTVAGTYTTTALLNMRTGAGKEYNILFTAKKGETVQCYGYYNLTDDKTKWLLVVCNGVTCYCSSKYLKKNK